MAFYNIISSSSKGNCIIYNETVMVDVGGSVSYKKVEPYLDKVRLIIITHEHSDHFNRKVISRIAENHRDIAFAGGSYMIPLLVECGVSKYIELAFDYKKNMYVKYDFGICILQPVKLYHDVENIGLVFMFDNGITLFHATDTHTLENIRVPNMHYYAIEHNYIDEWRLANIERKEKENIERSLNGERSIYINEYNSPKAHMSFEYVESWLEEMGAYGSKVLRLHMSTSDKRYNDIPIEYVFERVGN